MFKQNGLSLEQAPPISVVFRFFFSGTLFGLLAGVLLLIYQRDIFDPTSMAAITLTHVFTLGVMLSFMLAALFQILPVIAGVILTSPVKKANWIQYPLSAGIICLLLAFNFSTMPWLYLLASVLLGNTLLFVAFIMLQSLLKLQNHSASSRGITVALISLTLLVTLALYLTFTLGGYAEGRYYAHVKTAHYAFGLFGWITLLIMAISFQVIEMFYVTPAYPGLISKYLPSSVLLLLIISPILGIFIPTAEVVSNLLLAVLLSTYALVTLKRLTQRKRPISDATMWFWRLGMVSLLLSMFLMSIGLFVLTSWIHILSSLFFASFALSIVFAMFYKIVPFLTWFHLNSQGYFAAPMMHEVIHPKTAKKHFWIHVATLISFMLSLFVPQVILSTGLLMILSFGWMSYQIIHAHMLYVKTQKEGEKFTMGA